MARSNIVDDNNNLKSLFPSLPLMEDLQQLGHLLYCYYCCDKDATKNQLDDKIQLH